MLGRGALRARLPAGHRFGGDAMTMFDTAMGTLRATVAKALGLTNAHDAVVTISRSPVAHPAPA